MDIYSSNWNEDDNGNSDAALDGAPASIGMRTAGADGVFDTGVSDHTWWNRSTTTAPGGSDNAQTTNSIVLAESVDNGTFGTSFQIWANNIQAVTSTKFHTSSIYLDSSAVAGVGLSGYGSRNEADRITGLRIFPSSGTVAGRATLYASV
jgi:hypothetical protein